MKPQWGSILDHCSFEYMKAKATESVPLGGAFWDGAAQTFIHKGTNGRWREVLSEEESSKYEHCAAEELDRECVHWLATGEIL
jgi:aryl sulfotransferase